jgi:hypothetical protein
VQVIFSDSSLPSLFALALALTGDCQQPFSGHKTSPIGSRYTNIRSRQAEIHEGVSAPLRFGFPTIE